MTTKQKTTTGKGMARKLTLKRETIRDLNVKRNGKNVKGGGTPSKNSDCACCLHQK
jgi:hypothetical protein